MKTNGNSHGNNNNWHNQQQVAHINMMEDEPIHDSRSERESGAISDEDYDPEYDSNDNRGASGKSISPHALLKIKGTIHGREVAILLDDGSSHDFISTCYLAHTPGVP